MEITKRRVSQILRAHGWGLRQPTAVKDGEWCEGTDFISEMGDRVHYDRRAVYDWLGY